MPLAVPLFLLRPTDGALLVSCAVSGSRCRIEVHAVDVSRGTGLAASAEARVPDPEDQPVPGPRSAELARTWPFADTPMVSGPDTNAQASGTQVVWGDNTAFSYRPAPISPSPNISRSAIQAKDVSNTSLV